jgi:hypothetical protein
MRASQIVIIDAQEHLRILTGRNDPEYLPVNRLINHPTWRFALTSEERQRTAIKSMRGPSLSSAGLGKGMSA